MKFFKGVITFLVLFLAAYGAFSLYSNLTKPSKGGNLNGDDVNYLETELGIKVRGDGRSLDSGINTIIDFEGVEPIGVTVGASSSFAPPTYLGEQTAPSFSGAAPPYTSETSAPAFTPAFPAYSKEFNPPPNISVPTGSPTQPFPVQALPPITPRSEVPVVPATESPPHKENWDGPASNLSATFPSSEPLLSSSTSPSPQKNPLLSEDVRTANPFGGGGVRRIEPDSGKQNNTSSVADNVPMDSAPPRYTPTSARQTLAFETVRPGASSKTPLVAFAAPKQPNNSSPSQQSIAAHSEVNRIENPRPLGSSGNLFSAVQPQIPEIVERFIQTQRQLIETGASENIRLAFIQLSRLYEHDQLSEGERTMLRPILDALALKVIYSKDSHILESPYLVKPGETIESIAKDFNLNPVFLRKINGLSVPRELAPGTTLKVVYGQFDAKISPKKRELTLLLGGLYAGQFSFTFTNTEKSVRSGEFFVTHRSDQMVALNNGCILATAHANDATILFADQDAQKIFDILSEQSVIVVE